ncbi:MAG: hypothetical protein AAF569_05475 [Pseudomonadota bacterium]
MQIPETLMMPLRDLSDRFSVMFSSDAEMFFYIFCFIAFHMIIINMFYGKPSRRSSSRMTFKRSILIMMVVAEIVIFSNLLTLDYFSANVMPPEFSKQHVHSHYGH